MSFEMKCYKNKSEMNAVNKTLILKATYNINIKEGCSLSSPVVLVGLPTNNSDWLDFNYVTIDAFKRSYFVTDIVASPGGIYEVHLKCDVLSSFKATLLTNTAIINRQENDFNPYMVDSEYPLLNDTNQITKKLTNGKTFNTATKIVTMNAAAID